MLTGKQIVQEGIVFNLNDCENQIQQVGVDLSIREFNKVGEGAFIPKTGKTKLPNYESVSWNSDNRVTLEPGVYECVFNEDT